MRSMINFSDEAILKGLKEKHADSIHFLYREYFPLAKSIVEKNSGSYEDAEDVFQDGEVGEKARFLECRRSAVSM